MQSLQANSDSHGIVELKMPGADKERAKRDKERAREEKIARDQRAATNTATTQASQRSRHLRPLGLDGPADSSSGAPGSRGRPESSTAPSVGQPIRGQSQRRNPSQGPSQGARTASQTRGTSSRMLPDRDEVLKARLYAARYIDLPATAYTIGGLGKSSGPVSTRFPIVQSCIRLLMNLRLLPIEFLKVAMNFLLIPISPSPFCHWPQHHLFLISLNSLSL